MRVELGKSMLPLGKHVSISETGAILITRFGHF